VLGNLSDLAFGADRYEDALGHLQRALELAHRAGDRPTEWFVTSETTYALYQLGRWDEALSAFGELPRELLPSGHVLLSPLTSIVPIHLARGELDQARALCEVYGRLEGSIDVQERSSFRAGRAALAFYEGRFEDVLAGTEELLAAEDFVGSLQNVKLAFPVAVEAALAVGQAERVEHLLATVERQPAGLRTPLITAQAHRYRGRMAESPDAAEAAFAAAERILRETSLPFWLAVVQLEHAEARIAHEPSADMGALLAEARVTFDRLAARPWLERLTAVEVGALHAAVPDVAG
jgi:hypothetical protein